jgi:hypothetical protein
MIKMDIDRPTTPELVRSKAFTYGKDGIKANDIPRESISNLRLLFRKNAASSRVRAATKPWVTAQLQLYGIPFKKSDGARELKAMLETAVKTGKVCLGYDKTWIIILMCSSAIAWHHLSQRWRSHYLTSTDDG